MCNQGRKTACIYLLNALQNLNVKGFSIKESNGKISLVFKVKPVFWERFVSDLIKDKVILEVKDALRVKDKLVYIVYNLWKFLKLYEKENIVCDLTLLKYGVFSSRKDGELFETYGHVHKKSYGECYKALKNDCFVTLANINKKKAYFTELKEGRSIFIPSNCMHRLIAKDKDCLVAGFTIKGTGHDYSVVRGRGFPFHLFKKKGKIVPIANPKYKGYRLEIVKNKTKLDAEKLFFKDVRKLISTLKRDKFYKT